MPPEFHGIPVNPRINPGEYLMQELAERIVYRVNAMLEEPAEIAKIEWIISFNEWGEIDFEWAEGAIKLDPDGEISHATSWSNERPNLYVILHDNEFIPNGCTQVERIEAPEKHSIFQWDILWFLELFKVDSDVQPDFELLKNAIENSFKREKMRSSVVQLIEAIFIKDNLCEIYKGHLPAIADQLCFWDASLFSTVFTMFAEHMTEKEFQEALEFVLTKNNNWPLNSDYQTEIRKTIEAISEIGPKQGFEKCIPGTVPLKTPNSRSGFVEKINILEGMLIFWIS